ncbi:MAG: hypothetical protein IPO66_18305 [Rhodanobacteraceae bacterium]|nr:hypothetical protein [Rhodanobacteraceae bacterium]
MVEVYWQALTRDVPFADYASNSSIAAAVGDLNNKTHQIGPVVGGRLTPASLFRGTSAGDLIGPYISQFLLKDIPYGPTSIAQRYKQPVAGSDYMKVWEEYLAIQNGRLPTRADVLDATPRYIYNGRALANWVHSDFSYQAFLNAALIALGYGRGALSSTNPYLSSANQGNFIDFGGPDILNQVAMAARVGLAGAWFQKWQVHRRLRPEVMAARAEIDRGLPEPRYLVHGEIANSVAASRLLSAQGNILLPMAFPEGSPTHPAYPAGHAAIAGACTTVLGLQSGFRNSGIQCRPAATALRWKPSTRRSSSAMNSTAGVEHLRRSRHRRSALSQRRHRGHAARRAGGHRPAARLQPELSRVFRRLFAAALRRQQRAHPQWRGNAGLIAG